MNNQGWKKWATCLNNGRQNQRDLVSARRCDRPVQGSRSKELVSLTTCQRVAIAVLIGAGVIVRVVLAVKSPQPYGYVWDFYHEGIQVLYEKGRLPLATDCWQCYHPPLFYLAGWPFYDLGEKLESQEALKHWHEFVVSTVLRTVKP